MKRKSSAQVSFFDAGLLEIDLPWKETLKLNDVTFVLEIEAVDPPHVLHDDQKMVARFEAHADDRSRAGYSGPIVEGKLLTDVIASLKGWAARHMEWMGQKQDAAGNWYWPGGEDPHKVYMRQQREKYGEDYSEGDDE